MADVQRAGGVRRHELHVDVAPLAHVRTAILRVRGDDVAQSTSNGPGVEPDVDEPRPGNVRLAHAGAREIHEPDEIGGDLLRLAAQRPGKRHGEIRRPLAERRITRALEHRRHRLGRA